MPEYLSPGVYVEEQPALEPIEGVSTSTTGFVGMTVRGPIDGPPVLVTSFSEFTRIFGGFIPDSTNFHDYRYLPYAVKGFFDNMGKRAYIVRITPAGSAASTDAGTALPGTTRRLKQDAVTGATKITLNSTQGIDTTAQLTLQQFKNGITTADGPLAVSDYNDQTGEVTLGAALTSDFGAPHTTVTITPAVAPGGTKFQLSAADPGVWGDSLDVKIRPSTTTSAPRFDDIDLTGAFDTVLL